MQIGIFSGFGLSLALRNWRKTSSSNSRCSVKVADMTMSSRYVKAFWCDYLVEQSLERGWCGLQAERHDGKLKKSFPSDRESCQWLAFRC